MMKTVKETLLGRVSCRRYERESLTPEQIGFILEAVRNTPTSYNGQNYTVIDISDQSLKEKLYEITGQKQIKTCARFLAFCMDYNKICVAARAKGLEMPAVYDTVDGLMVATIDASMAMMSAIVAAQSLGLGTCPIGYLRTADPEAVSRLLGLPQHVSVVCGLAIGVPREHNDPKPKQPLSLLVHPEGYRSDDLAPDLLAYDAEVTAYNASRSGQTSTNDWISHMLGYYREMCTLHMADALKAQGFETRK